MALEEQLQRLIAAIDTNTAALKSGGDASPVKTAVVADTKPKAEKPAKGGLDFDTIFAVAKKVMSEKGRPFAKKLIKDVGGAADLANVKPGKYPALLEALEAALNEPEDAAGGGDDDDEL